MRVFQGEILRQNHRFMILMIVCLAAATFRAAKAAAPLPPDPISIQASNQQITLAWKRVSGAAGFRVYRSFVSGRDYEPIADVATGAVMDYTFRDTGLMNGVPYYYTITAFDSTGVESAYSSEVAEMPGPQVISAVFPSALEYPRHGSAPLIVVATPGLQNYLPPYEPASGFISQVRLGPAGQPPTAWTDWVPAEISGLLGEDQPLKVTASLFPAGLTLEDKIYFVFRFSTNGGISWTYFGSQGRLSDPTQVQPTANLASISLTSQASVDNPSPPGQPVEESTAPDWVSFSWSPSTDTDDLLAYDIYRTGPGDEAPRLAGRVPVTSTSFKDTGLRPQTAYTYTIRAVDTAFLQSPPSASAVIHTLASAPLAVTIQARIPPVSPGEIFINRAVDEHHLPAGTDWQAQRMTCDKQTLVCSASLSLQAGAFYAFRISRGSAETVQTLPDGNTPAPEGAFVVRSLNGAMTYSTTVYQWDDPLVVGYSPSGAAVDRRQSITMVWNQAMPSSTTFTVEQKQGGGWLPVSGEFRAGANRHAITFDPTFPLVDNATFRVQAFGQVDDYANTQQIPFNWEFSTGPNRLHLPLIFH